MTTTTQETYRFRVLPYKHASQSARALAGSLGGLRLKDEGRPFKHRAEDVVINWGSSYRPERLQGVPMLNDPDNVKTVINKLDFFQAISAVDPELVPDFWTSARDIPDRAFPVVCRTVLEGHSGSGIVIADTRDEIVPAPLYVKYIKKSQEYRVHVGRVTDRKNPDKLIAVQRKARVLEIPDDQINWKIRNLEGGFIFARAGVTPPARVTDAARKALEIVGLDFGAADVIDNESKERAYVLEINSAPGLEGRTMEDYKGYFTPGTGAKHGLLPRRVIARNDDGSWHAEYPYLDKYGRRRWYISDFDSWDEAMKWAGNA